MRIATKISRLMLAFSVLTLFSTSAPGEPLPDRDVLKFLQLPMIETFVGGQVYCGHDEQSSAYSTEEPYHYQGFYMADDFADKSVDPVVHVQWWGSYLAPPGAAGEGVQKFLISFEKDVAVGDPENLYEFSHPGEPILSQVVTRGPLSPGSGTFTETLVHPGGPPMNEELFMYNAELYCPFEQEPDTVYWLKIVALVDSPPGPEAIRWGWHNRDYTVQDTFASTPPEVVPGEYLDGVLPDGAEVWHFQDDAVEGEMVVHLNSEAPCDVTVDQLLSPSPPLIPDFTETYYVEGIDGPQGIGQYSKDLAFALYTIPEPGTMSLLGSGVLGILLRRRRRHNHNA